MLFPSRKNTLVGLILWVSSLLLVGTSVFSIVDVGLNIHSIIVATISFLTVCFFLGIWFKTYYKIVDHTLHYRSGPIFGTIDIQKIREISANKTMYVGLKPALATKGLIIKYEKYNDIYISPEQPELFIQTVQKINPSIVVT